MIPSKTLGTHRLEANFNKYLANKLLEKTFKFQDADHVDEWLDEAINDFAERETIYKADCFEILTDCNYADWDCLENHFGVHIKSVYTWAYYAIQLEFEMYDVKDNAKVLCCLKDSVPFEKV